MIKRTLLGLLLLTSACKSDDQQQQQPTPQVPLAMVPGHDTIPQDNSHKETPRLMPAESYMRTYLQLFGGQTALQAQTQLSAGGSGLFDNWNAYLGALGLPNYLLDLPRRGETNALMIATFERLGVALCDKAVEKDLLATPAVDVGKRLIYAFDVPKDPVDQAGFAARFDSLHRLFLSYPANLAPTDRTTSFFKLYQDIVTQHTALLKQTPTASKFTPTQAGWAAVCSGLVRHPEFHLY